MLAAREQEQPPVSSTFPDKENVRSMLQTLEAELRGKGIVGMALFGSLVHSRADSESDIDILIDIAPETHFSLIDFMDLKLFLEDQLGHEVDLVTREGLDLQVKDEILEEAESVFS